jgi:hypothetical protein
MRIDPHRLTLWLALFATGATYLALSPSYRQAVPPSSESPWIGLPDSGMDASEVSIRELLNPYGHRHVGGGDPFTRLAWSCGQFQGTRDSRFPERYIAHVSDSAWAPSLDIIIEVDKDQLLFSIRSADYPPPPPPPSSDGRTPDMITIRPVTHLRMEKSRAEPIRQAWNNDALWHAPQKADTCVDDALMMLEACVDGRYAVRRRSCIDNADNADNALRTAFKTLLPAPEPIYERAVP